MDLEANPCTILADALGVTPGAVVTDRHGWHLSVVPDGWLKGLPEHQIYDAATVDAHGGTPLYRIYGTGEVCAFDKPVGKGRVIAFLTQITAGFALLDRLFAQIGYAPALQNDYVHHGVVVLPTRSPSGRMLHVLNVDDVDKTFLLSEHGKPLFEGRPVSLPRKEGLMLPYGIKVGPFRIAYATLEAIRVEADAVTFRGLPGDHAVRLFATRPITATHGANIADAALGERIVTVRLTNFDPTFTIAVRS
jgi:beta-galactosidase